MRFTELASRLDGAILSEAVFSGNAADLISEWNAMQQEASNAMGGFSAPPVIPPITFRWLGNVKGFADGDGKRFGSTPSAEDFVSTLPFIEKHGLDKKDIGDSALGRSYEYGEGKSAALTMRHLVLATTTGFYDSASPFVYNFRRHNEEFQPEWNEEKVQKILDKQDQKKWYETLLSGAQNHVDSKTVKGKYKVYIENPFSFNGFYAMAIQTVFITIYPSHKTFKQFASAIKRAAKKEKINLDPTYGAPKYDEFVKANQDADAAVERVDSDDRLNNDENLRKMAKELRREFDKGGIRYPHYQYYLVDLYDRITGSLNRYSRDSGGRVTTLDVEKNAKEINQKYKSLISMTNKLVSAIDKKIAAIGPQVAQNWSIAIEDDTRERGAEEVFPDYPSYKKAVVAAKRFSGRLSTESIYVVQGTQEYFKPIGTTKEGGKNSPFWFVRNGEEDE